MREGSRWLVATGAQGLVAIALLSGRPLESFDASPSDPVGIQPPHLLGLGLSGVTPDGEGHFWAVSEDRRELYRVDGSWSTVSLPGISIAGISPELEPESAAWLGGDWVALGTEIDLARDEDTLLIVELRGEHAAVVGSSIVSWRSMLGLSAPPNQGIEGLCASESTILAAAEFVIEAEGQRLAALVRAPHHDGVVGEWQPVLLRLTSDSGKLSALDCTEDRDRDLDVLAVERHYGVTRVLRFTVPRFSDGVVLPEIVRDVSAVRSDLPNIEGIALGTERILMLSDHEPDSRRGPTELLIIEAY